MQENVTHFSALDGRRAWTKRWKCHSRAAARPQSHEEGRRDMSRRKKAEPAKRKEGGRASEDSPSAGRPRPEGPTGLAMACWQGRTPGRARGRASQGWIGSTLSRVEEGDFERRTDDRGGEGNASRPKATWPSLSKVLASVARRRIHSSVFSVGCRCRGRG